MGAMAARYDSDGWEDDEAGSTPCACGKDCAERDYQGNPALGPRDFCATDERYVRSAVRALPGDYASLSVLLAKSGQQEEKVTGGGREAPVPVALDIDAFMREMVMVAVSWEEQVRASASLSDPEEGNDEGRRRWRDGTALQRACDLLAGTGDNPGYLTMLLSLEPEEKRRYVPGNTMLRDLAPGTRITIDSSGDAWGAYEVGGTYAGLEFLRLHSRARGILGLTRQRRKLPEVPCDRCGSRTLFQREAVGGGWEPVARCSACPEAYIGSQFELLMGRVYSEQVRVLGKAS